MGSSTRSLDAGGSSRSLDTPRSKPGTRSAHRGGGGGSGVSDGRGSSRSLPGGYSVRRASGRDLTPRALHPRGRSAHTSPTRQPPAAVADGSSVGSGGGAGQGDGSRRRGRHEAGFRPVDGVASPRDSPRPPRHAGVATPGNHSRGVRPPSVPQSSPHHRHGAAPPCAPASAPAPGSHALRASRAGPLAHTRRSLAAQPQLGSSSAAASDPLAPHRDAPTADAPISLPLGAEAADPHPASQPSVRWSPSGEQRSAGSNGEVAAGLGVFRTPATVPVTARWHGHSSGASTVSLGVQTVGRRGVG